MHKAFHYSLLKQFAVGEGVEPSKEILNQQKLIFPFHLRCLRVWFTQLYRYKGIKKIMYTKIFKMLFVFSKFCSGQAVVLGILQNK